MKSRGTAEEQGSHWKESMLAWPLSNKHWLPTSQSGGTQAVGREKAEDPEEALGNQNVCPGGKPPPHLSAWGKAIPWLLSELLSILLCQTTHCRRLTFPMHLAFYCELDLAEGRFKWRPGKQAEDKSGLSTPFFPFCALGILTSWGACGLPSLQDNDCLHCLDSHKISYSWFLPEFLTVALKW